MESSWRGMRSGAWWGRAGLWQSKGGALGKPYVDLPLLLLSRPPHNRLDMNPPGSRGVIFLRLGARAMERGSVLCLCQSVPRGHPHRTPHTVLQGKNRPSAPQAEENRASSLASSGFNLPA